MSDPGDERDRSLRRRVVDQFSGRSERAAAWRGLERVLPTGAYLNLGYTPRYLPTLVGDSQARLAGVLADGLAARVADPAGCRLLDVGCGRGGPTRQFAARGFDATGLDLVAHNVALARAGATSDGAGPAFAVGDATALPFADGAFGAAAAVDALVYVPEPSAALAELARVLGDGGCLAVAALLARPAPTPVEREALAAFADAWDMAPLQPAPELHEDLAEAGFTVEATEDVTANSVGRLRRWSRPFLALADGSTAGLVRTVLRRLDVPPEAAIAQVRAAHRALPALRHQVLYARR